MNKAVVFGLGCLGVLVLAVIIFGLAIAGRVQRLGSFLHGGGCLVGAGADSVSASSGSDSEFGANG